MEKNSKRPLIEVVDLINFEIPFYEGIPREFHERSRTFRVVFFDSSKIKKIDF